MKNKIREKKRTNNLSKRKNVETRDGGSGEGN
jgi:molybdenum-dependent DNA-binding transcriptional regulator ModE